MRCVDCLVNYDALWWEDRRNKRNGRKGTQCTVRLTFWTKDTTTTNKTAKDYRDNKARVSVHCRGGYLRRVNQRPNALVASMLHSPTIQSSLDTIYYNYQDLGYIPQTTVNSDNRISNESLLRDKQQRCCRCWLSRSYRLTKNWNCTYHV